MAAYSVEDLVNDISVATEVGSSLKAKIVEKFTQFKNENNLKEPKLITEAIEKYKKSIAADLTKQTNLLSFFQKIYNVYDLSLLSPTNYKNIKLKEFEKFILLVHIFPSSKEKTPGSTREGEPFTGSLLRSGEEAIGNAFESAQLRLFGPDGYTSSKDTVRYMSGRADDKISLKSSGNKKNTQNFLKPANYQTSNVNHDTKDNSIMQKKADKFSKQYYQDAISGLDDAYAKSYYAGLKSMYDKKQKKTKADYVKLYELHDETGPELIGSAHPKSIGVADAMGNGGLLENQIEQQRANIGVARSVPSGNFLGRHAWVLHNLVKLAESADERGDLESSDLIDAAIEKLNKL